MSKVIVYKCTKGKTKVVHPTQEALDKISLDEIAKNSLANDVDYKEGDCPVKVIDKSELPKDRVFREAWDFDGDKVKPALDKSKELLHKLRREKREQDFKPYDDIIQNQIPGSDFEKAENERQKIRVKYAECQEEIQNTSDIDDLYRVIDKYKLEGYTINNRL